MPKKSAANLQDTSHTGPSPVSAAADVTPPHKWHHNFPSTPRTLGFILIFLGAFFLFQTVTHFEHMAETWPLILVAVGLAIMAGRWGRA